MKQGTSSENVQSRATVSDSGLEVEYQVPTSSQRDHEEDTDAVIVVESDEEGDGPDEGEGADDDPDEGEDRDAYMGYTVIPLLSARLLNNRLRFFVYRSRS